MKYLSILLLFIANSITNAFPDFTHQDSINLIKSNICLNRIAKIESNHAKYLNHKKQKSGIHKNMQAGGPWGMMPNTVLYLIKKYPNLQIKYKKLNKTPQNITKELNENPKFAVFMALYYYNFLKTITKDDKKIAYYWNKGHNSKYNPNSFYVKWYNSIR